ncbi:MAG: phosphatase PAP2 family protein [Dongiaceae bacterium]
MLFALVALHVAAALALPALLGIPNHYSIGSYVTVFTIVTVGFMVLFALGYPFYVALVVRPSQPGDYLRAQLRDQILSPERLCNAIPVLIMIPVAMSSFTWFKVLIPFINPFSWDPRLAAWDAWLHGGHQPWELLQPVLGIPIVTSTVTFLYHLWIFAMCGVVLWQTLSTANPRTRMQYLITLVLLWIVIGNLTATILSSAGPVYFGRVTGLPDPFAPLMDYLHAADQTTGVMALEVQDLLWQSYLRQGAEIGRGISAMPSMHLASSFSFVLIGFATSRRLGILFSLFCATIMIGSVHLGWHYAIDGYVAIVLTWLIWRAVGWLLDRPAVARRLWPVAPALDRPR